ncbi:TPA: hypothetical protein KD105_003934 [Vibrio parahaemolyticus]|nr:hypothetical protein [Vibrio parahaemolyticus]
MIVSEDTHPERKVYYWGAIIIEFLCEVDEGEIPLYDFFEIMKKRHNISVEMLMLSLDWLFILNAIEQREGRIVKCF